MTFSMCHLNIKAVKFVGLRIVSQQGLENEAETTLFLILK